MLLLFVGILSISLATVSAEQTVDVGGKSFILPPNSEITHNDSNTCNFTTDNILGSIMKIDPNDLQDYIHSNRSKKYEIVRLSSDQGNLYRYEDSLHNEKGVVTPLQEGNDTYIFKLYMYSSFSNSTKNRSFNDKFNYMGIYRGFLTKNGYAPMVDTLNPPI